MFQISKLALVGALVASTPAFAQDSVNQIEGLRIDLHLAFERFGYFGAGARFEFPVVPRGLVAGVDDELAISLGADLFFAETGRWGAYDAGAWIVPLGLVQWNFYVEDWSFFPELGVAVHVGLRQDGWSNDRGREYGRVYPGLALGLGARYHFNPATALLLRVGAPGGLQVGVVF